MSIASRIENMYDNVDKAYKSIGNLGVDLTNVDKNLENISTKIEEIYDTLPKVESEDTDQPITLENTAKGKLKLDYKGNTSQFSTTGKNLLNCNSFTTSTTNGITFTPVLNENGTLAYIKANGTSTGTIWKSLGSLTYAADTYTFYANSTDVNLKLYQDYPVSYVTTSQTVTFSESITKQISINIESGKTLNNARIYPMVAKASSISAYEPYTGNAPSPSPDYPQDIHTCSGDNTIEIVGKNLFDYNKITTSANYTNNYDGSFTRNSNGTNILINVDNASVPYDTFSLKAGAYSVSFDILTTAAVTLSNLFMCTRQSGTSTNLSKSIGVQIPANTITHIKAENYVVVNNAEKVGFAGYLSASTGVVISNIQVEKNNQATAYEAYTEQSQLISLGSLELCKIGTYQDYIYKSSGKWYVHKEIGKIVLDGNEDWIRDNNNKRFGLYSITTGALTMSTSGYCNYFGVYDRYANTFNSFGVSSDNIRIYNNNDLSLADWETWLSTHNTILYFPLATPTNTEITDTTLISQLENTLYSYQEQTNISQENNDEPFIIKATALYDFASLE